MMMIPGFCRLLSTLHLGVSVNFHLTELAGPAFEKLKMLFSTVPVLQMANPHKQFIVEVDASSTGVGMVMSQWEVDGKVHPCAFFSRWLSSGELNYDVGNRELLVVKLILEEWRHWSRSAVRGQN